MVHVLRGNKPTYEKEPPSSPDELVERIASARPADARPRPAWSIISIILLGVLVVILASGVDCAVGMWRGLIAPGGITDEAAAFWTQVLSAATATDDWRMELEKKYWANTFMTCADERRFLDEERAVTTAALRDIGLIA